TRNQQADDTITPTASCELCRRRLTGVTRMTLIPRPTRRQPWIWALGGALGALLTANVDVAPAQSPPAPLPQTISAPQCAPAAGGTARADAAPQPPSVQPAGDAQAAGPGSIFAKVPPIPAVLPKPGVFFMPPQGPGYYSFWDLITDNYRNSRP